MKGLNQKPGTGSNQNGGLDLGSLEITIGSDIADMEAALAAAIALKRDVRIRSLIRPSEHRGPFAASLPGRSAWLKFDDAGNGVLQSRAPDGVAHVHLDEIVAQDPTFTDHMRKAAERTGAYRTAQTYLRTYLFPAALPNRAAASRMLKWSLVVDKAAYRTASRAIIFLDASRSSVLAHSLNQDRVSVAARRQYWMMTSLVARCLLLAADARGENWLQGVSDSVKWDTWTPSRSMVRERSLWLTAIGARSAASFGDAAIGRYLERLDRVRHPIDVLDVLIGVVSIGLAESRTASQLVERLRFFLARIPSSNLVMPEFAGLAIAQAISMLQDVDVANEEAESIFGAANDPNAPLGIAKIVQLDPTCFARGRQIQGLSVLPIALARRREDFFPRLATQDQRFAGLKDEEIYDRLTHAWDRSAPPTTMH